MARFLGDMWGHAGLPEIGDEVGTGVALVGSECQPPGRTRRMAMNHVQCGLSLGMAISLGQVDLNNQTMSVLHQSRRRENGPPDRFLTLLHP